MSFFLVFITKLKILMVANHNYHIKFGIFYIAMVVALLYFKLLLYYLDIFKDNLSDAIEPKKPKPPSIPIDLPFVVG